MFIAICNIPGYLPESDPFIADTAASAWQAFADEREQLDICWTPDNEDDPEGPASLDATQLALESKVRDDRPGVVQAGDGYVYTVEVATPEQLAWWELDS